MIPPTLGRGAGPALFVDLDGTMTASDLLADAIVLAIRKNPLNIVRLVLWAISGRAHLKRQLARRITPDVSGLPYRSEVIDFLTRQRSVEGRRIVLATASDALWAEGVARQIPLFDHVIASNGEVNLKGRAKLEAIQAYCRQHDIESFDYIGDSHADVPIWQAAETALAVDPDGGALRSLNTDQRRRFTGGRGSTAKSILLAMRPQQWVKNLLLLTPLLMAHQLTNLPRLMSALAAVVAFSLCASAIYIVNDLLDVEADRRHPTKKRRPFASGRLSIAAGPPLALALAGFGALVAVAWLPRNFQLVLATYLVLTTLYSFWLKSKVMINVVLLSVLYTLRVLAGGMATDLVVSEWMMSFSMFIFTSLAFAKRYSELRRLAGSDQGSASMGRGYQAMDLQMLGSVGPASGYLSVLVLALYLNSEQVTELYVQPLGLWPLCPLMLYWIGRLWIVAGRGELPDDPVAYAVTDRGSWIVAACAGIVLLAAV